MAIIAAIKNVLSPNSETTITDKDARNACIKLKSENNLLFVFLLALPAVLIVSGWLMCLCEFCKKETRIFIQYVIFNFYIITLCLLEEKNLGLDMYDMDGKLFRKLVKAQKYMECHWHKVAQYHVIGNRFRQVLLYN